MNSWTLYSEHKPTKAGVYEWRVPSKAVPGAVLIVAAHMRMRGAGHEDVLSPHFDHWTGYRVVVGAEVEWRETNCHSDMRTCDQRVIEVEGLEITPCIYCGKVPRLIASETDGYGTTVLPKPWNLNTWQFSCCPWGTTPRLSDPREIERIRREAFARLNRKEGE